MAFQSIDLFAISGGRIPGMSVVIQNGRNPTVGSTLEPIWNHSTDHTWQAAAAAHYISSSSGADGQVYQVTGLDANWNELIVNVTAAGQTKTRIGATETFIRINRVENIGATNNAGAIYVYEDDTVTAGVPQTDSKIHVQMNAGKTSPS